jgi:hypothetical protein
MRKSWWGCASNKPQRCVRASSNAPARYAAEGAAAVSPAEQFAHCALAEIDAARARTTARS